MGAEKCDMRRCEYLQNGVCQYERMTTYRRPCPPGKYCDFHIGATATKNPKRHREELMAERQRLYDQGMTDEQIAREQGLTEAAVRTWRCRLGLPIHTKQEKDK